MATRRRGKFIPILSLLLVVLIFVLVLNASWGYWYPVRGIARHDRKPLPFSLVAHALGNIDSIPYSNSYQAFLNSYRNGFRAFEVDLEILKSGELICFHRGSEGEIGLREEIGQYRLEDLAGRKFAGKFDLMTAEQFIRATAELSDFVVITDTKGDFATINRRFVELAREFSPTLLQRIVPQIYEDGDINLAQAEEIYDFQYVLYSLYKTPKLSTKYLSRWLAQNKISGLVLAQERISEVGLGVLQRQVPVFVHSVTSRQEMEMLQSVGVRNIYVNWSEPTDSKLIR